MNDFDLKNFFEQFQDFLAPKLDAYEQAIYLYIFRHSRLLEEPEVVVGFKSARTRTALGTGKMGSRMSENTCYEKIRSLAEKRCVEILDSTSRGTKLRLHLPSEIDGLVADRIATTSVACLDELDCFNDPIGRNAILQREGRRCFYCLRVLDTDNHVVEHVVSRPTGNSTYRNVVAACRGCNNRKGSTSAEDFVRHLYRESLLTDEEVRQRLDRIVLLKDGQLKPVLGDMILNRSS